LYKQGYSKFGVENDHLVTLATRVSLGQISTTPLMCLTPKPPSMVLVQTSLTVPEFEFSRDGPL